MTTKYKTAEIHGETRITKDGHTMTAFDVLMDLERLARIDEGMGCMRRGEKDPG